MRPLASLLVIATLGTAVPAAAQTPAPREQASRLQDTAQLRQLEQQHTRGRTAEDQVAAGFAALRLWELTEDRAHARRSRQHFDQAARVDPDNAWAHYGHALSLDAEIRRGDGVLVTDDAIARALGYDAVSRGRRALERALALDPTLPGAAELLTRFAVETQDQDALEQARDTYEQALAEGRDSNDVLRGLVRSSRELGDYERSAEVAQLLVQRGGDSIAYSWLELATSLASVPDRLDDAADAYAAALDAADHDMLVKLWGDASMLTRSREDVDWNNAKDDGERRRLLRTMWDVRGALADMSGMERAAEHYRRMNVAWREYRRSGRVGAAPMNALRLSKIDARYSDMGVIYIRHGEPDEAWTSPGFGTYTVWFYPDDDGRMLSYHFVRHEGEPGWSKDHILVRMLPCPMSPEVAAFDRRLYPLTVGPCSAMKVRGISINIQRDAENALLTDSHRATLDTEIPFHFDTYTFRGANGSTEVVAAIGVPADRMPAGTSALRMSLAIVDSINATVERSSALAPVPAAAGAGALLRSHVTMQVAPTQRAVYRVGIRADDDVKVGMTYGGRIAVPNYSFRDMMLLSDVVLAEPGATGSFQRGPHRLSLAPTQVFAGGAFRAYYEIYHLPAGTRYRTELQVRPANRGVIASVIGRDDGVKLEFDDVVPDDAGDIVRELRDVVTPFPPGEYLLTVTVRAEGRRPMTVERKFTVTPG